MNLVHMRVHNFRGILDSEICLDQYSLFVGANNSGKTTIIDAIRAFYEKDGFKFKKENDFPLKGYLDNESWVEMTFQLTEDENISLKEEYQNDQKTLRVKKVFLSDSLKVGLIFAYKSDGSLSTDPFYGARNVQSGKFGDLIYIPAVSKVDEHTKLSGPSALRDLISNIMSDVVENSDAYKNLSESVKEFSTQIKTLGTNDNHSLAAFEKDFNKQIAEWDTTFQLTFTTPSTSEIIKSMLGWELKDNNYEKALNVDSFGSGFQRQFIYSLIQLGAKYMPVKVSKKEKDFTPSFTLLLFEEPEAFLHPSQQEKLARSLMSLGKADNWQVICSTHSSHFVSRRAEMICSLVKLERTDGICKSYQLSPSDWKKISSGNQSDVQTIATTYKMGARSRPSAEDNDIDMESIKFFLWLNPDRASLFFAEKVLLVEGPTEVAFINKLIDDGKIVVPSGAYVLDCLGKWNMHRFMNLFGKLNIKHSVLYDDDAGQGVQQGFNQLLQSSRNLSTCKIQSITNDIETFLGVSPATNPHRKPQHLLFH